MATDCSPLTRFLNSFRENYSLSLTAGVSWTRLLPLPADSSPGAHVDVLHVVPGGRPAFEVLVEFKAHTSASNRDKISIPLVSALCFRSSSKGSMRMIIFRPGVRPFSTFPISINAFWGVSQITVAISAESRNRAGGHLLALLCT